MSDPDGLETLDLVELLVVAGVEESEIQRARENGTLGLLAIEHLVLTDLVYDIEDIERQTGVPVDRLRSLWGALGFAEPRPGDPVFNQTDVELLVDVEKLMESGLADPDVVVQLTRVIGASMARIAGIQADLVLARERDGGFAGDTDLTWFGEMFTEVLDQVWRRHLHAAARSRLTSAGDTDSPAQAVGFADLVGFTAMSQQLDSGTLASVVDRFESVAYATVNEHGGRVVKMIGDEVMFAIDDPVAAARCALDLAESYHDADDLSDVRVGVAYGRAIDRDADLFGPPVNLASRLTAIALPGTVLIDEALHDELDGHRDFVLRSMLPRRLKHLGLVRLWVLRQAEETDEHRGQRRERRRARIAELAQGLLPGGGDDGEKGGG